MSDPKNDLGTPNWRRAAAYPDADSTSDSQWRWEFLRRRPDYREAWVAHFDEKQKGFDKLEAEGCLGAGATREHYRDVGTSLRNVTEPFGVSNIVAPWRPTQAPLNWRLTFAWAMGAPSLDIPIESLVNHGEQLEAEGIMFFAFDINRPFDEQIKAVRHHFEAVQKEHRGKVASSPRQHKRKWATYLRAIDARDQGATYADLYTELELSSLSPADYDAELDRNLSASGLQLWQQARDLMFKMTS